MSIFSIFKRDYLSEIPRALDAVDDQLRRIQRIHDPKDLSLALGKLMILYGVSEEILNEVEVMAQTDNEQAQAILVQLRPRFYISFHELNRSNDYVLENFQLSITPIFADPKDLPRA